MSQSQPQGRSYWVDHIEAWRASGMSRAEYCQIHGLSRKTFGWWTWRLDQERRASSAREAPRFVPVELTEQASPNLDPADPADERIEIALPGGVAVRVGSGFDAAALHRVLTVLGR
jgi:hypothetical protein